MKALVWEAPREMAMRERDEPAVAPGEALLRVAYAGICGSELSGYLGHNALRVPPLVMGHEFSGHIVALGSDARRLNDRLREGQAVTANPLMSCGECRYCREGNNQLCVARQLIGAHRPGAYAELVSVPAELIAPLPDGLDVRLGALTEPVACAVRLAELAGPVEGEQVLVIGAGPIGLLTLQTLRARGAAVLIADRDPERLRIGAELGGEPLDPLRLDVVEEARRRTGGLGAAVAVDAVGTGGTRAQCVAATRSGGLVMLSGLHEESSSMPAAEIIRREIRVRGCFSYSPANFAQALELLARRRIRLDPWIVEAPLADGGSWFDRLIEAPGDVAKVLLIP